MTELSSNLGSVHGSRKYASGGIEFHQKMRALDNYHKDMVSQINMYTRKMEAKQDNTEKFREVRRKELEREIDELEEDFARAKLRHQDQLNFLENGVRNRDQRREVIETRKDLTNNKIQFMRDLYKFDPRWKDKLRAKKQMELNRLEYQKQMLRTQTENIDNELGRELDHRIKDTKFDIYKLQKHAEIKRNLLSDMKEAKGSTASLFKEIHAENLDKSDHEEELIKKKLDEEKELILREREEWERQQEEKKRRKTSKKAPSVKIEDQVSSEGEEEEDHKARSNVFNDFRKKREQEETKEETERLERQQKLKEQREKRRKEAEEEQKKQDELIKRQQEIARKKREEMKKKIEQEKKQLEEEIKTKETNVNKKGPDAQPLGIASSVHKIEVKEEIKEDTKKTTVISSILQNKKKLDELDGESEDDEESDESEDIVFKGTHQQDTTVNIKPAGGQPASEIQNAKSTVLKVTKDGAKIIGSATDVAAKNKEPTNEIPVVASDFQSSEMEEEMEELESENDIVEDFLKMLKNIEDNHMLKIVNSLFEYIDQNVKREHGSFLKLFVNGGVLEFDIHTTQCFEEVSESNGKNLHHSEHVN
jgi:hypothetical protein